MRSPQREKRPAGSSTMRLVTRANTLAPVSRTLAQAAPVAEAGHFAGREDGGSSASCVAHPWRAARPVISDSRFPEPPATVARLTRINGLEHKEQRPLQGG